MLDRKDKTHFLEIDILRSLAIIFIVIYHLIMFLGDDNSINNIIQAILLYTSYLGLGLFFFISGFILNSKYQNIASFMDAIKFYWRRLLRIYPLYLMGLGLAIFIWGFLKIGYFSANFNAYDIIANVLNLREVFISIIKIPNVWFVSAILIFYLIFSLSMSISKNTPYLFLVLFIFFILLIVMHRFFNLFEERIFIYYNIFVFGILFNSGK
jgi:peptidoglycan/LPS O-acetylase OafA/YrhL